MVATLVHPPGPLRSLFTIWWEIVPGFDVPLLTRACTLVSFSENCPQVTGASLREYLEMGLKFCAQFQTVCVYICMYVCMDDFKRCPLHLQIPHCLDFKSKSIPD